MGLAAPLLSPVLAGYTIIVALAMFATARAFCSVTSKDVLGRAVPIDLCMSLSRRINQKKKVDLKVSGMVSLLLRETTNSVISS